MKDNKMSSWLLFFGAALGAMFLVSAVWGGSAYGACGAGALAAAAFLILSGLWNGPIGKDGQFSSSKLQMLLWNATFAYCFVAFWSLVLRTPGLSTPTPKPWIWAAIGLSATTALAAKGITVGHLASGKLQNSTTGDLNAAKQEDMSARVGSIVSNDAGTAPDITKIQLLFWTAIGVIVVLSSATEVVWFVASEAKRAMAGVPDPLAQAKAVAAAIGDRFQYPDLDMTILILAGIGQGVYLGNKLFDSEQPRITGVSPSAFSAGDDVTVLGMGFGTKFEEGQLQFDGVPIELLPPSPPSALPGQANQAAQTAVEWTDAKIRFKMPPSIGGKAWTAGAPFKLRVAVRLVTSVNEATVTLK